MTEPSSDGTSAAVVRLDDSCRADPSTSIDVINSPESANLVDLAHVTSPLREWIIELIRRHERIARAKADGDGLEVTLCMKRDGYIPPPKIKSY